MRFTPLLCVIPAALLAAAMFPDVWWRKVHINLGSFDYDSRSSLWTFYTRGSGELGGADLGYAETVAPVFRNPDKELPQHDPLVGKFIDNLAGGGPVTTNFVNILNERKNAFEPYCSFDGEDKTWVNKKKGQVTSWTGINVFYDQLIRVMAQIKLEQASPADILENLAEGLQESTGGLEAMVRRITDPTGLGSDPFETYSTGMLPFVFKKLHRIGGSNDCEAISCSRKILERMLETVYTASFCRSLVNSEQKQLCMKHRNSLNTLISNLPEVPEVPEVPDEAGKGKSNGGSLPFRRSVGELHMKEPTGADIIEYLEGASSAVASQVDEEIAEFLRTGDLQNLLVDGLDQFIRITPGLYSTVGPEIVKVIPDLANIAQGFLDEIVSLPHVAAIHEAFTPFRMNVEKTSVKLQNSLVKVVCGFVTGLFVPSVESPGMIIGEASKLNLGADFDVAETNVFLEQLGWEIGTVTGEYGGASISLKTSTSQYSPVQVLDAFNQLGTTALTADTCNKDTLGVFLQNDLFGKAFDASESYAKETEGAQETLNTVSGLLTMGAADRTLLDVLGTRACENPEDFSCVPTTRMRCFKKAEAEYYETADKPDNFDELSDIEKRALFGKAKDEYLKKTEVCNVNLFCGAEDLSPERLTPQDCIQAFPAQMLSKLTPVPVEDWPEVMKTRHFGLVPDTESSAVKAAVEAAYGAFLDYATLDRTPNGVKKGAIWTAFLKDSSDAEIGGDRRRRNIEEEAVTTQDFKEALAYAAVKGSNLNLKNAYFPHDNAKKPRHRKAIVRILFVHAAKSFKDSGASFGGAEVERTMRYLAGMVYDPRVIESGILYGTAVPWWTGQPIKVENREQGTSVNFDGDKEVVGGCKSFNPQCLVVKDDSNRDTYGNDIGTFTVPANSEYIVAINYDRFAVSESQVFFVCDDDTDNSFDSDAESLFRNEDTENFILSIIAADDNQIKCTVTTNDAYNDGGVEVYLLKRDEPIPTSRLGKCEGHCYTDGECDEGLVCAQTEGGRFAGCSGKTPDGGFDYRVCVSEDMSVSNDEFISGDLPTKIWSRHIQKNLWALETVQTGPIEASVNDYLASTTMNYYMSDKKTTRKLGADFLACSMKHYNNPGYRYIQECIDDLGYREELPYFLQHIARPEPNEYEEWDMCDKRRTITHLLIAAASLAGIQVLAGVVLFAFPVIFSMGKEHYWRRAASVTHTVLALATGVLLLVAMITWTESEGSYENDTDTDKYGTGYGEGYQNYANNQRLIIEGLLGNTDLAGAIFKFFEIRQERSDGPGVPLAWTAMALYFVVFVAYLVGTIKYWKDFKNADGSSWYAIGVVGEGSPPAYKAKQVGSNIGSTHRVHKAEALPATKTITYSLHF